MDNIVNFEAARRRAKRRQKESTCENPNPKRHNPVTPPHFIQLVSNGPVLSGLDSEFRVWTLDQDSNDESVWALDEAFMSLTGHPRFVQLLTNRSVLIALDSEGGIWFRSCDEGWFQIDFPINL